MKKYILYLSVLLVSCSSKEEKAVVPSISATQNEIVLTKDQYQNATITTGKLEEKLFSSEVKVSGMLHVPPQNLVSISTPFTAYVRETELLEGMKVKKGQKIAMIEHPDFIQVQQDYLDMKSQLEYLELDYQRQKELSKENVNATKALQKSKSEYLSMQAKVNGLKVKLKMMHVSMSNLENGNIVSVIPIYAPISGYVTKVNTNIGAYVGPNDVLFELANTAHLHAEIQVFESDVPKIKIGQKVKIQLLNETGMRSATIYLIGKEINADRTVQVHCHLDKEDENLMPGVYLKAFIQLDDELKEVLPKKAVVNFQNQSYIFVQKEKMKDVQSIDQPFAFFEAVRVKTGVENEDKIQILNTKSSIKDQVIVINGAYALLSKLKNTEEE